MLYPFTQALRRLAVISLSYITASYGYPELDVYTVSGKDKKLSVMKLFGSLRPQTMLITNAKCLTEGVVSPILTVSCLLIPDEQSRYSPIRTRIA